MDTPKPCPNCGSEIPPDAPGGWCPRCTFQQLAQDEADEHQGALSLHDIPQPGATVSYIGDYELLEIIAHGGMGVVYKARQKSLNRIVALKLLLGGVHASEDFKQRFRQEAELAAQLQHPNIVAVYEAGIHEGQPYFSMEYVPGHDLATLTQGKPLPPKQACEYLKTIAEAVHHAHVQGVLHRDLKPSNILLGVDGRLRITDFGLAKRFADSSPLTLSGATLGTPGYLPPEQVSTRRGTVGVTSDVYSLGAILYHLLTGRAPFQGEAPADVLMQVLNEPPVLPSEINPLVPMEQEAICLKCLAKDPGQRFSSAKGLAQAFDESVLNSRNVLTGKIRIFRYFIARNAFFVGLATILFAGAMWFGLARLKQHGVMGGLGRPDRLTNSLGMVFVPAPDTNLLFSIWHTRVQDFAAFVKETGYEATNGVLSRPPEGWKPTGNSWLNPGFNQGPTHPVCGVSWEDAQAFCTWLTGKERREGRLSLNQKYRLPTDAEWSVAVGLGAEEGDLPFVKSRRIDHVYPWGNQWPPPEGAANLHPKLGVDTFTWTSPVGSFKPNPFGLHDMGGNVWQWCEDWYDPNQRVRVKRGSSWLQPQRTNALSSARNRDEPGIRRIDNGFRVVLELGKDHQQSRTELPPFTFVLSFNTRGALCPRSSF